MTQRTRVLVALAILAAVVIAVLGVDRWQRSSQGLTLVAAGEPTLVAGSIPIYLNDKLVAGFQPSDLERLSKVSFVDDEEGKTQEGWLLRDVILLYVQRARLKAGYLVTVSSSSRAKSMQLTWAEVDDPANWVMFDLAGRGTLKLVSVLERLDVRDEWIQDVDRIEVEAR